MTKQRYGNQEHTGLKYFYLFQLTLLLFLSGQPLQTGIPFYKTYSSKIYKAGPQNWDIVQDHRGIMYFGNSYGVLEFDGTTWRLIPTEQNTDIISLTVDSLGHVYAASQGYFGHLTADEKGEPVFHNLSDTLKSFRGSIYEIQSLGNSVFISTDSALFRYSEGHTREIAVDSAYIVSMYVIGDSIYFMDYNRGIFKWDGEGLTVSHAFDAYKKENLWLKTESPDERTTVYFNSFSGKLYTYAQGSIHEIKTDLRHYFKNIRIIDLEALSNGLIALLLDPYGIVVVNKEGQLVYYFDIQSNLMSQSANVLYRDRQGGLWVGLNDGIMRLEYPSAFMSITPDIGIRTGVTDIKKYHGDIYVTTLGRFYKVSGKASPDQLLNPDLARRFGLQEYEEIRSWCWGMVHVNDHLFIAADNGLYQLKTKKPRRVVEGQFFSIRRSYLRPDIFYLSGFDTLYVYSATSRGLKLLSKTFLGHSGSYSINEAHNGDIWVASYEKGFYRLRFEKFTAPAHVQRYGVRKGLPSELNNNSFRYDERMIFLTEKGLMNFDSTADMFVRDTTRLGVAAGRRLYLKIFKHNGQLLLGSRDSLFYLVKDKNGYFNYDDTTFGRIAHNLIEAVYTEDDGTTWFGLGNGIIRFNPHVPMKHTIPYHTSLRRISFGGKELYGGMARIHRRGGSYHLSSGSMMYHPITYNHNSAYFKFSLPSYDGSEPNQYQYRLIGYDSTFSSWSFNTEKEYTNLAPGKYTFEVRGKDAYNAIYPETNFPFEILAPWYATIWAYLAYLITLAFLIYLIVSWRSRTLKKLVAIRTAELTETNRRLMEAKAEADRATHFKSLFLANMSHEIRTPLNGIIGMNSLLKNTPVNEEQKDFLEAINVSAESLLSIVNDILDFSKIEAGKLDIENVTFSLRQIVEDVTSVCKVNGKPKKLNIHAELPDDLPALLTGDPVRIRQILLNFTTNAVKFTEHGHIIIRVEKLPQQSGCRPPERIALRFSVEDTGIGIPGDKQAHIFNSFQQADHTTTRKYGGTGLGLTICKMLTDLMGGEIGVESRPNVGSTFWFTLCLPVVESTEIKEVNEPGEKKPPRDILKNIHVLVAEDNLINQKVMTRILGKNNIGHSLVPNGREAINFIKNNRCDLILMDVQMPEMDGIEATRQIRMLEDPGLSTIPIIALTANAVKGDKERCLAAGMNDYLSKPINVETMLLLLKKYGSRYIRSLSRN